MRIAAYRVGLALSIFMVPAAGSASAQAQPAAQAPASVDPLDTLQLIMDVHFREGSMAIVAEDVGILENFLERALERNTDPIELIGHTDNRGEPAKELAESEAWANAVGQFLVSKGIAAERISIGGMGATRLIVEVPAGVLDQHNRRVRMTLGKKNVGW